MVAMGMVKRDRILEILKIELVECPDALHVEYESRRTPKVFGLRTRRRKFVQEMTSSI